MKWVMANGCFDPLHPGHVAHLIAAREMGDALVVALTVDKMVTAEKGPNRPNLLYHERELMLCALRCVDKVIASHDAVQAIKFWKPAIFVKGGDYVKDGVSLEVRSACLSVGAELRYTSTPRFGVEELVRRLKR